MPLIRITSDSISANAITNVGIANGTIVSVDLADGSVTGSKIAVGAVSGNQIGIGAVSGNQIGIGAISANNFAGGGITSNVLSSNLSISLTRAIESANISSIAIGGNVNIDIQNNVLYFFNANTTANITFNLRANTQNTFDSITSVGQSVTVAFLVKHGSARHTANIHIDGGLINNTGANAIYYIGNTKPVYQSLTSGELNSFSYTILKTAANSYTVIASNNTSGLG